MKDLLRSALFVLLASCATAPPPFISASGDRHGASCSLDRECPGGSCRSGTCSWISAQAPDGTRCHHDMQCNGGLGSCRQGSCFAWPPERSFHPRP